MSWIGAARRLAIYMRDDFTCQFCEKSLLKADPRHITLDHLVPRSKGGTNRSDNLVTACLSCNSSKQARSWRKFAKDDETIARILRVKRRVLNMKLARSIVRRARAQAKKKPVGRNARSTPSIAR